MALVYNRAPAAFKAVDRLTFLRMWTDEQRAAAKAAPELAGMWPLFDVANTISAGDIDIRTALDAFIGLSIATEEYVQALIDAWPYPD